MTAPHHLSPDTFALLAGGGGDAAVPLLRAAQRSKHLVQLRALLDSATELAPAAAARAHLDENARALATVQRRAPDTTAEILAHPQVGAWAAQCLRRLRLGKDQLPPLWFHLAHLGGIAAAAAIRAGVEVETTVPIRSGMLFLPALGRAYVGAPHRWALARGQCEPRRLRIVGDHGVVTVSVTESETVAAWQPLRRLHAAAGGLAVSIEVEDLDPYRHGYGLPASGRIDDDTFRRWQVFLDDAWAILSSRHRGCAAGIAAGVVSVVPLNAGDRVGGASASSREANGAVALTPPESGLGLAVTLVHEIQHSKLNALHDLIPLYEPASTDLFYSPWRADPRPLAGLLHGTYAFLGVAEFWRRERSGEHRRLAEFEFARVACQVRSCHRALTDAPGLTPAGRRVVRAMGDLLDRWRAEPIASDAQRVAEDLAVEHRVAWRLRNAQPDRRVLSALAASWSAGAPMPAALPSYSPENGLFNGARYRLARKWASEPAAVDRQWRGQGAGDGESSGAATADAHLILGAYAEAAADYRTRIAAGKAGGPEWTGLVIAEARLGGGPAESLLQRQPELVRALHQHLAGFTPQLDPLRLAAWIADRVETVRPEESPGRS